MSLNGKAIRRALTPEEIFAKAEKQQASQSSAQKLTEKSLENSTTNTSSALNAEEVKDYQSSFQTQEFNANKQAAIMTSSERAALEFTKSAAGKEAAEKEKYEPKTEVDEIALEKLGEEGYKALKDKQQVKKDIVDSTTKKKVGNNSTLVEDAVLSKSDAWWTIPFQMTKSIKESIIDMVVPETTGMSKEQESKFKEVSNDVFQIQKPIALEKDKREKQRLATLKEKIDQTKAKLEAIGTMGLMDNVEEGNKVLSARYPIEKELEKLEQAYRYEEKSNKRTNDFLENSGGWEGLMNNKRDLATAGVLGVIDLLEMQKVARKAKEDPDSLEDSERQLLESFSYEQKDSQSGIAPDNYWYKTMDGLAHSLVFMEGMIITGGAGNLAKQGVTEVGKNVLKSSITAGIKNSIVKGGIRSVATLADIAASTAISPMTYQTGLDYKVGQIETRTDENGKETILLGQELYETVMLEHKDIKAKLNQEHEKLSSQKNLNPQDQKNLLEIESKLNNLRLYEEKVRPKSNVESAWKGFSETFKENFSEKVVGGAVDKLGGKVLTPMTKRIADRFGGTPLLRAAKSISTSYQKAADAVNATQFGSKAVKYYQKSGVGKIINSPFGEFAEEIAVQATPTYGEDYIPQLRELINPSFYADVAVQTMIMSGGFTAFGGGANVVNRLKNPEIYKARENALELYNRIASSSTDADVIDQILMNSATEGYTMQEYDAQIRNLKAEDKQAEAAKLEKKKFYNLSVQAMRTNTLGDFEKALGKVASNENLSAETKTAAALAQQDINTLKKTYHNYRGAENFNQILTLASQRISDKNSIGEIEAKIASQINDVDTAIKAHQQATGTTVDFDLNTLFTRKFDDETEQANYDKFLSSLAESNSPEIVSFLNHTMAAETLKQNAVRTNEAYNEAIIPSERTRNRNTFIRAVQTRIEDIERINQNYTDNNLENNGIGFSDKLLEDIINSVATKFEGKISKEEIAKIKGKYKSMLVQADTANILEDITRINKKIDDSEVEVGAAVNIEGNIPSDEPPVVDPTETNTTDPPETDYSEIATSARGLSDLILDLTTGTVTAPADPLAGTVRADEDTPDWGDDYSAQPASISLDDNQQRALKNQFSTLHDAIANTQGKKPSFDEVIGYMMNYDTKENVENQFNVYKMGWELNNLPETNFDAIYNSIFDPAKEVRDAFLNFSRGLVGNTAPTEVSEADMAKNTQQQLNQIEQDNSVITSFTEENIPVRTIGGRRINVPDNKLAYNSIKYIEVEDADGRWERVATADARLNLDEDSLVDFRDLLNPDLYTPGTNLSVAVVPENLWVKVQIVLGRDSAGKPVMKNFAELVAEETAKNPDYRNTAEFKEIVPIITIGKDGKALSFIHDVNWYNPYNVADPSSLDGKVNPNSISTAHNDLIQEGKTNVRKLRTQILDRGLRTITIAQKKEGAFFTIEGKTDAQGVLLPLYTISEANPQSEIAIQFNQGTLEIGNKTPFDNDKRKVINRDEIIETGEAGHTWHLRRIGVDSEDGKETWRAFKVTRRVSPEQLETVRWAWAAYGKLDKSETLQNGKPTQIIQDVYRKNVIGTKYDLSDEQAEKIVDEIQKATGYNLHKWKDANAFFKLYLQPRKGDKLTDYGNSLFKNEASFFAQHTSNEGLTKNGDMVHISEGIISPVGRKYKDYLKDTLLTGVKSFNVGTEDKPVYATSIQPVITFEYENEVDEVPTPETRLEERNEVIQETVATQAPTENVDELLNQFKDLKDGLGFTFNDYSAQPVELNGIEHLRNIFNITPGLTIAQEERIVDFVFNYVSSSIDAKYKSKANKAQLFKDLEKSYEKIVGPARKQVEDFIQKLQGIEDLKAKAALNEANQILNTLINIKDNWTKEEIQKNLTLAGVEYTNQLGIVDKAMEEVYKNSDIKETIDSDEDQQNEQDLSQREKSYEDNASLTESGKQKTSYRLRRFMAGIEDLTPEGDVKKGFLGLPMYVGFNDIYDSIYQLLGTGVYIQSDYKTMKAKLLTMKENKPWIVQLIRKMDAADIQIRKEFVYNYRKHAISMKFAMLDTQGNSSKLQVYDTNANEITKVLIKQWRNNFKVSPLVDLLQEGYAVDKVEAQGLLDQYNNWDKDRSKVPDAEVRDWLNHFGINLSDAYFNELKSDGFKDKGKIIPYNLMFSGSNTPIGLLQKYLVRIIAAPNTNFEDNKKNHPFGDMNNVLKSLATGAARHESKILSKSFRDAGKNISGLTNPTYVTNKIDDLKRAALGDDKKLIEDLQSLSISQDSLILNLLTNEPEFASKFEVNHLGLTAIKVLGKKSNNFSSITDLNSIDHDVAKLTMFQDTQQGKVDMTFNGISMRIGRMFSPTMSDKTQMTPLATGVFNFMQDSVDSFVTHPSGELRLTEDVREILYKQLVLPELRRIINFQNKIGATNIDGYDMAAQIFNFIPELNNIRDADGDRMIKIIGVAKNITLEKVEAMFKTQMMDTVEELVHNLAVEKMNLWQSFKVKDKKGETIGIKYFDTQYMEQGKGNFDDKFKVGAYDFVMNSMITNADIFTLIAGDPAMFAKDKNFEDAPVPFDAKSDNFYREVSEKMGVNIGKRLALLIAPGATLADSEGQTYNQVFLQDSVDISANTEYLIKLFYGKEALDKETTDLLNEYNNTANQTAKKTIRTTLAKKFPKIGDYFKIESTDAQEYTTVSEHIMILEDQGRLTKEQSIAIGNKLLAGETLEDKELNLVMQPIKPVYTGQIIDKDQDVARMVYIKSSAFPLLPQVTVGTKLDKLRIAMEDMEMRTGKPVRASYQTANKVGSMKGAIDPFNEESLKLIDKAALVLNRNDFRIQQDVPYKSDMKKEDKVSMGTQIFKLLMGNGIMQLDGFSIDGQTYNGRELFDYYNTAFTNLVELKRQKLFKELGLDKDGNTVNEKETIYKLQALLQEEAVKRGYPLQDIKGLELDELYDKDGNPYYEFKVPLWLSTNSNRYESLLNSIVSNRIMQHKIPGNAFVAGSESGFGFQEDLANIDQSRIIYLDNWNGKELQGVSETDGTFTKAQVFVPSKFKDTAGKLVDLFAKKDGEYIYLTKRENGTWNLKEGMIAPELLNNFSFRTPTSGHKSASSIEIAGILPPEVGDLMIVPKNFTKQKGLDYDIDKETAYQLNHVVNYETGKIEVLTEKHKDEALATLRKLLAKEDKAIDSEFGNPALQAFYAIVGVNFDEEFVQEIQDLGNNYQEQIEAISAKFDEKLYENQFIKAHLAVFNNPNKEVQKKINAVLSMQFAQDQANLIEDLTREAQYDKKRKELVAQGMSPAEAEVKSRVLGNTFSILSDEYQKKKMGLGSAGKAAIGIYSNYVTFHSLVQQTPRELRLMEGPPTEPVIKEVTIGKITSTGVFGRQKTLGINGTDGDRSVADAFEERQNTATDNEKEQILGRVNINGTTIGVDSLLTLLGFDKDENGNSVSYMLLSQPILRDYVSRIEGGKGITADFQKDLEMKVILGLIKEYVPSAKIDGEGRIVSEEGEPFSLDELLTGDNMISGIKYNGENPMVQIAALAKFLELKDYAVNIAKAQGVLNTNNLGKSIVESNIVYENLKVFSENSKVANMGTLVGDFIHIGDVKSRPEGYSIIGDYYVKPNTPQGQIVVNGLVTGQKLWGKYFPYNDPFFEETVKELMKVANIDQSSNYKVVEARQEAIQEIKKYLYSRTSNGLFTGTASYERERLFIDTPGNTSLANYLNGLSENETIKANKLLNKLTYNIETDGRPSTISFNNTVSDNFDEKYLYNALAEMIIENKPLPNWNGEPFSTKQLAQELVSYAYVEGGVQEATQFIKYIPIEYLEDAGYTNAKGEIIPANQRLQLMNSARDAQAFKALLGVKDGLAENETHTFVKQYMQHNPDKAKQYSKEERKELFAEPNFVEGTFILNSDIRPKFISVKNTTKSKLKQDKYTLYEHTGAGGYQRISVLGASGMNEYEYANENATSLLEKDKREALKKVPVAATLSATVAEPILQDGITVTDALSKIANSTEKRYERYKMVAELLMPFVDSNTQLDLLESTVPEMGVEAQGGYSGDKNRIVLSKKYFNSPAAGVGTFLHEVVHSVSKREIAPYYNEDGTVIKADAPAHVVALHRVWTAFKNTLDPAVLQAVIEKNKNNKSGNTSYFTPEEIGMAYAGVDIFEFMSVAMESRLFQEEMSKIPYAATGQSIWEKFKEAVIRILRHVNPEIKPGSLAEAALNETLNFIAEEKAISAEKATFVSAPQDDFLSNIERDLLISESPEFNTHPEDDKGDPDLVMQPGVIKEGVDFVFKDSPELLNIGTQGEYSQYLDTIFPDSKVKDIVYHTTKNKFDKFDKGFITSNTKDSKRYSEDSILGFFFSRKENIEKIPIKELGGSITLPVILNFKNPTKIYNDERLDTDFESYGPSPDDYVIVKNELINKGYDSIDNFHLIAFESEQIHILGSKQDIEGFKDYKKSKSRRLPEIKNCN